MRRLVLLVAFGTAVLLLGSGCGGSQDAAGSPGVLVKGSVKLASGKPLSGGQIAFHPANGAGKPVAGNIVGDGTYSLTVPAGDYKVTVDNSSLKSTTSPAISPGAAPMPGMSESASVKYVPINPNYASPDKSGLTVKVEGKEFPFDVELK